MDICREVSVKFPPCSHCSRHTAYTSSSDLAVVGSLGPIPAYAALRRLFLRSQVSPSTK